MANTYLRLYIHLVFAVKYHEAKLEAVYRQRIYDYMKRVSLKLNHGILAIGGTDNHVHILLEYNPRTLLADYVREMKTSATNFINMQLELKCRFAWQRGYAAFTHSHRELPVIKNYIANQTLHHQGMTLQDEIRVMLTRYEIDYEDEYLFENV